MKFNDFRLSSDKECEILKKSYSNVLQQEVDDLSEILEKMVIQKENIERENVSGEYGDILIKLTEDIEKLKNIVHSTIYSKSMPTSYTLNVPSSFRKVTKMAEPNGLSPFRSIEENERAREYMESVSPTPNVPLEPSTPITPNTPTQPSTPSSPNTPTTNSRRSRPMRGFSIANIIKKFALNKEKSATTIALKDRWRYHTIVATACHPRKQILHNQSDILRLLLLYMVLRPTCRYMSVIANITNSQFESYVSLSELENE